MSGARAGCRRRRTRRRGTFAGACLALLSLLAPGARASEASPAATQIQILNFQFVPPTLEVGAGATVTWVNGDEEIHTITSRDGLFTSPGLDGEQRFSFRFVEPGTYEYGCALHPQMKGTVVVR